MVCCWSSIADGTRNTFPWVHIGTTRAWVAFRSGDEVSVRELCNTHDACHQLHTDSQAHTRAYRIRVACVERSPSWVCAQLAALGGDRPAHRKSVPGTSLRRLDRFLLSKLHYGHTDFDQCVPISSNTLALRPCSNNQFTSCNNLRT